MPRIPIYAAPVRAPHPVARVVTLYGFLPIAPFGDPHSDNRIYSSGSDEPLAVVEVDLPCEVVPCSSALVVSDEPAPLSPQELVQRALYATPGYRFAIDPRDRTGLPPVAGKLDLPEPGGLPL